MPIRSLAISAGRSGSEWRNCRTRKNPEKPQNYQGLVEYFNEKAPPSEERIDYSKLTIFFKEKGIAGLNNHLTEDENRRLFTNPHVAEMIALTLKGLVRIRG
jgi:hypothetical protein